MELTSLYSTWLLMKLFYTHGVYKSGPTAMIRNHSPTLTWLSFKSIGVWGTFSCLYIKLTDMSIMITDELHQLSRMENCLRVSYI